MKPIKTLFLLILTFLLFIEKNSAQNEYPDFHLQDTTSEENFTIFNLNDFRDALVQLGINVYKWTLPIPQDNDYKLCFYVQEYEGTRLVIDTVVEDWSTKNWGFDRKNHAIYIYLKNLRIITEMPENDNDKFKLKFSINSGKFQFGERLQDRIELRPYFLRKFEETEFEIGKNIPLLLYTSGEEIMAAGQKSRRFCGPNYPAPDLSDNYIKNSIHYFVIGYRVVDEEFYGRD
jgi:hypothetical protein